MPPNAHTTATETGETIDAGLEPRAGQPGLIAAPAAASAGCKRQRCQDSGVRTIRELYARACMDAVFPSPGLAALQDRLLGHLLARVEGALEAGARLSEARGMLLEFQRSDAYRSLTLGRAAGMELLILGPASPADLKLWRQQGFVGVLDRLRQEVQPFTVEVEFRGPTRVLWLVWRACQRWPA